MNGFTAIEHDIGTRLDSIVHSTCKLLGHLGTHPEYGRGVVAFPKFIKSVIEKAEEVGDTEEEELEHLKAGMGVRLVRQVGSRYFVTSRNAGRIFFLAPLAVKFLHSLELVKELNGLERDVLKHLTTPYCNMLLKADGLFFEHVYADLMCLLKSKELSKSFLDMNQHYFELLMYLENLAQHPRLILDKNLRVFPSEPRLYGDCPTTNHRLHKNYMQVCTYLYKKDDTLDEQYLFPLVQSAAKHMADKIKYYKPDQLPGGKFWDPPEAVRDICKNLVPTNDFCESILGLNDWLQKKYSKFYTENCFSHGRSNAYCNTTMVY